MTHKDQGMLSEVPETMLWTLHNRASEAMRRDGILEDPKAVEIYRSIDYDYVRSFGPPDASHSLRSLVFDREITAFLGEHPRGVVVNLGEGLETQRFRVDRPDALWLSVDLPQAIEVRERFIEPDERHVHVPVSAFDRSWLDEIPEGRPAMVTAQGLFMYFNPADVRALVRDLADHPAVRVLMFDTIPGWFSRKTLSPKGLMKTEHYRTPPMPWGINRAALKPTMREWLGAGPKIADLGYPRFPRGLARFVSTLWALVPGLGTFAPSIVRVQL
ncbi:MAG: class I SAM-dependent methyltransferase [Acidobacteriota bacterium]